MDERGAAVVVQAHFRGHLYRSGQLHAKHNWHLAYGKMRMNMVFQDHARNNADTRHLRDTMHTLKSLVPHTLYHLMESGAWSIAPDGTEPTPLSLGLRGAVCFFDISGFVSLTERIVKQDLLRGKPVRHKMSHSDDCEK